ncbi:MAG TPA: hypothetical protein DCX17_01235 [Firmicutes bacterium]|jgi:predicted transcriptional regulator YdeE|nr:hypothetical protein [Bacillota bacterium]
MIVKLMPEMTLAFLFTEDKVFGDTQMNEFLTTIGSNPEATKKYFFRITARQRATIKITYALYAIVPEGTKGKGKITIVNLPSGEYLMFTMSKHEFDDVNSGADEKIGAAAKEWLKEHNRNFDMRNIFGLVEEDFIDGYEMYNLYFPIK